MACEKCTEGWLVTDAGAKRCSCNRPLDLTAKPPVIPPHQARLFVEMLAAIPFFPADPGARTGIGDEIRSMCNSLAEADWLVKRMMRLYERWPGPNEMRRVLVSKHVPRDGVMPIGISEHYPDGVPSENPNRPAIEGPKMKALPPGQVSANEDISHAALAAFEDMPAMPQGGRINDRFSRTLAEVLTAPADRAEVRITPQVVTQADIDKAVEELRAKKASENAADTLHTSH